MIFREDKMKRRYHKEEFIKIQFSYSNYVFNIVAYNSWAMLLAFDIYQFYKNWLRNAFTMFVLITLLLVSLQYFLGGQNSPSPQKISTNYSAPSIKQNYYARVKLIWKGFLPLFLLCVLFLQ